MFPKKYFTYSAFSLILFLTIMNFYRIIKLCKVNQIDYPDIRSFNANLGYRNQWWLFSGNLPVLYDVSVASVDAG